MSEGPIVYYLTDRAMSEAMEWLLITARRATDAEGRRIIVPIPHGAPLEPTPKNCIHHGYDEAKVREAVLTALHSLTGQPWQVRSE